MCSRRHGMVYFLLSEERNIDAIRKMLFKKFKKKKKGKMAAMYPGKHGDIESANNEQLYPGMMENPQMRWGFIRKVYALLCIQLAFTFGVSFFMFFYPPVKPFMTTLPGFITFIVAIILTFASILLMAFYGRKHPWNYILMGIFTLSMAFMVGVICTRKSGNIVLEAAGLTALVTVGLTLYTFWAAKKGYDFSFLGPFLLCALLILCAFSLMRVFFPIGTVGQMVIGCISALIFSGFIIYDTDNIIKRFTYDDYIIAAAALYSDIINLFLALLDLNQ